MSGGFKQFDPNATYPSVQQARAGAGQFVSNLFQSGGATAPQSPLANYAATALGNYAANVNPEAQAFAQLSPLLMSIAQRGAGGATANPFTELGFQQQFSELQNPFTDLGAVNQAQQQLAAGVPLFDRNLQSALGRLEGAAPGRFSSALAQEGRDVTSQALQDFNLFAQQAIMQGLGLQQQEREAALNFGLGARGLQQQAAQDVAQNRLGARGLQQEAALGFGQLGQSANAQSIAAAQLLGSLAGQSGMNQFQRLVGAGQFGLQTLNPSLQLLLGSLGYGQPEQMVVQGTPGAFDYLSEAAKIAAAVYGGRGGG